jgi:hypothetical protein
MTRQSASARAAARSRASSTRSVHARHRSSPKKTQAVVVLGWPSRRSLAAACSGKDHRSPRRPPPRTGQLRAPTTGRTGTATTCPGRSTSVPHQGALRLRLRGCSRNTAPLPKTRCCATEPVPPRGQSPAPGTPEQTYRNAAVVLLIGSTMTGLFVSSYSVVPGRPMPRQPGIVGDLRTARPGIHNSARSRFMTTAVHKRQRNMTAAWSGQITPGPGLRRQTLRRPW